jgi:cobalamin biosynthesis protein CobT
MDNALKKKLQKAQNNWQGAREKAKESSGFTEVPDGRYLAHLTNAQIGESRSSGRLQIQWTWTISDGEFENDTKLDFDGLETEDNLVFLGRKLSRFGYELPEDITEISDILDELVEKQPLARIRLKTKGEFQNVYVDKLMRSGSTDKDDSGDESMASDDEDLEEADDGSGDEVDDESDSESDSESDDESDDDEGDSESDGNEEQVEIGMRVVATTRKGEESGEIIEIMESEGKCRVKLDTGRTVKIAVDKLEVEPIQEPPKKARRSPK